LVEDCAVLAGWLPAAVFVLGLALLVAGWFWLLALLAAGWFWLLGGGAVLVCACEAAFGCWADCACEDEFGCWVDCACEGAVVALLSDRDGWDV
jgi:hypothetical protein